MIFIHVIKARKINMNIHIHAIFSDRSNMGSMKIFMPTERRCNMKIV